MQNYGDSFNTHIRLGYALYMGWDFVRTYVRV